MTGVVRVCLDGFGATSWREPLHSAAEIARLSLRVVSPAANPLSFAVDRLAIDASRRRQLDGVLLAAWRGPRAGSSALSTPAEQAGQVLRRRRHLLLVPPVRLTSWELEQCGRLARAHGCVLAVGCLYELPLAWIASRIGISSVSATSRLPRGATGPTAFREALTMLLTVVMPLFRGDGGCGAVDVRAGELRATVAFDDGVKLEVAVVAAPAPGAPTLRLVGAGGEAVIRNELDQFGRFGVRPVVHPTGGVSAYGPAWSLLDLRTRVARHWLQDISYFGGVPLVDLDSALRAAKLAEAIVRRAAKRR